MTIQRTTASRETINIAGIQFEGMQMPDGSYRMSDADIARAIGVGTKNTVPNFRRSKAFKSLQGEGFTALKKTGKVVTGTDGARSFSNASSIEFAAMFWAVHSAKNPQALSLTAALAVETIERRFDRAFNVKRTEEERDESLSSRRARYYKWFAASLTEEEWKAGDKVNPTPEDVEEWAIKVREVYRIQAAQSQQFVIEEKDRIVDYEAMMADYD